MGIRRRIRKFKRYRYKLIVLIGFCALYGQSEYQITTIPKNAIMLSTHNGFENIDTNQHYIVSYLQYPSQINLLNLHYNKINISILDYGLFEDKIDNILNNTFYSYEGLMYYNFNQNIFHLFSLDTSMGSVFSKIGSYTSIALLSDLHFKTTIPVSNIKIGFSLKNLGIILKEYTDYKQKLPTKTQFYIIKKINKNIEMGYNIDYYFYTDNINHILLFQIQINDSIHFRLSNTNYSKELFYNNELVNGLALGLSIKTQKTTKYDFSISNLGVGGYIYGITMQF